METIRAWTVSAMAILAVALCPAAARAVLGCTPDRVVDFSPVDPASYGHNKMPDVVLGFPGESSPTTGSVEVASLGTGGSITLEFTRSMIVDGPGPDFIVFENAFFCTVPESAEDDYGVFAEPMIVEVSQDGEVWHQFPFDEDALDEVGGEGCTPRDLLKRLVGLAGITPTFTGDLIVANDPMVWDPEGVGGVSGWGGDAFDLADLGLDWVRFVRLTDSGKIAGFTGSTQGADLDAVVAVNAEELFPAGRDSGGGGSSGGCMMSDAPGRPGLAVMACLLLPLLAGAALKSKRQASQGKSGSREKSFIVNGEIEQ